MSLHDAYARITPFELAFPDRVGFDAFAESVVTQATQLERDATSPDDFAALPCVGAFLAETQGTEVPRVDLVEHGLLAFHGVHFVRERCSVFLLGTDAARSLVSGSPSGAADPPAQAGYLQLPQHLFWASAQEGGAPESVDGLFWTVTRDRRVHVLGVFGVRPDREGFGAFALPDAPLSHAEGWKGADVRELGRDFASGLPGADLDGLYQFETAGEVLKLLARFFAAAGSGSLEAEAPGDTSVAAGPRPSALPYVGLRRVA